MTDRTFAAEMRGALGIAATLLQESDTEETRMYVQHKLQEVRDYLQEKQEKGEKRLEEDIQKELKSIESLEERIAGLKEGTVTETDTKDYIQMYIDLKEEEWMEAFNALLENKSLKVERILQSLIEILKVTYEKCKIHKEKHTMELTKDARWAGDIPKGKKGEEGLTDEQKKELKRHVNFLENKTAQYCIQSISKKLLEDVKSDKTVVNKYNKQSDRVVAAFDSYIMRCIQFSWVAQFESPPIHLVTDPKRECPQIMEDFINRKYVPGGQLVKWPALVQGNSSKDPNCVRKIPWQLYEKDQERPMALPRKEPTPPPPKDVARVTEKDDVNDSHSDGNVQLEDNIAIHVPKADINTEDPGITDQTTSIKNVNQPADKIKSRDVKCKDKPHDKPANTKRGKSQPEDRVRDTAAKGTPSVPSSERANAAAHKKHEEKEKQPHAKTGMNF